MCFMEVSSLKISVSRIADVNVSKDRMNFSGKLKASLFLACQKLQTPTITL